MKYLIFLLCIISGTVLGQQKDSICLTPSEYNWYLQRVYLFRDLQLDTADLRAEIGQYQKAYNSLDLAVKEDGLALAEKDTAISQLKAHNMILNRKVVKYSGQASRRGKAAFVLAVCCALMVLVVVVR